MRAAALAEKESTGNEEGPVNTEYLEQLELQASIAPISSMIEEESRDETYLPPPAMAQTAEESEETEEEEEQKKKKKLKAKRKAAEKEKEEETPKKGRGGRKSAPAVPKADAALMEAIEKGDKDKQKTEGQVIRAHIRDDLMWPTSMKIKLGRLFTPHWMWRDRDLTDRHVERIKHEILKTPGKFFKVPIVQPVRLA